MKSLRILLHHSHLCDHRPLSPNPTRKKTFDRLKTLNGTWEGRP